MQPRTLESKFYLIVIGSMAAITAGLLIYSQTWAYSYDESWHLLAAQLIARGKRPYLDFFLPQTPLNAYWNAFWMRVLGESWHGPHAIAALVTALAVFLTADHVYRHTPDPRWRTLSALFTGFAVGMNTAVVKFGTVQAYGLILLLIVAGFRTALSAANHRALPLAAAAGLLSSAAAECSLLAAPVAPVLLLWMLLVNANGQRIARLVAFAGGAIVAWIPVFLLLWQSPAQVIFGIFTYHLRYREVEWSGWGVHNLEVALAWAGSAQAVMLLVLAITGLIFVLRSPWTRNQRFEYYLCACLVLAEAAHFMNAHPTFSRYFLFTVPFLAILASVGLCASGERLSAAADPRWAVGLACFLMLCGEASSLVEQREDTMWSNLEAVAAKVKEVTPPGAALDAEEGIYVLTRRTPPSGLENRDALKLKALTAEQAATLHILRRQDLDSMVRAGKFPTVETCDDDDVERLGLDKLYSNKATISDCYVYWGFHGFASD